MKCMLRFSTRFSDEAMVFWVSLAAPNRLSAAAQMLILGGLMGFVSLAFRFSGRFGSPL